MIAPRPFEFAPVVPSGANMPAMPALVRPPVNFAGAMVIAGGLVVWPAAPMPQPLPGSHETGALAPNLAFDNLADIASGGLEFRAVIEGLDTVFATNEDMAGTDALGRSVVPGLRREGIGFTERVYLESAEHEVSIDALNVDEVGGEWRGIATRVFSTIAERVTGLVQTLGTAGAMKVAGTAGGLFTVGERYYLGTETVRVSSIDASGVAGVPDEVVLERGQWGSTAQEHPVAVGEAAMATSIYDAPTGLHGRRVWLYAHTADELSPLHEGTIVWRGLMSREPTLGDDALSWSLGIDARTRALEASFAGGFDQPFTLRGIYYAGEAALYLTIRRHADASKSSALTDSETIIISGFWETQEEFCADLQAALVAAVPSWNVEWEVRAYPDTWDIAITIAGTPRYVTADGGTNVDGWYRGTTAGLVSDPGAGTPQRMTGESALPTVSASTTYVFARDWVATPAGIDVEDQRRVPRSNNVGPGISDTDANIATWPRTRLYLASVGSLSAGDEITIAGATSDTGRAMPEDAPPQVVQIVRVLSSVNAIEAAEGLDAGLPPRVVGAGPSAPAMVGSALYAGGDGDLADLRDDIIARAPVLANRGKAPWATADDIADWHEVVTEVNAGRAWLDHRAWTFAKPTKAIEVVSEELKLAGLIPYLDADARLNIRPFTMGGSTIDLAIGADQQLVDQMLGTVSGEADGIVTVVNVKTGYDPAEDKHVGGEITYRGLEAIARVHAERVLEIAPKSRAVGSEPTWEDLSDRGRGIISLFGDRRTQVVTVDVSLAAFGVLIADTVSLTIAALPSDGHRTEWSPGRGMVARKGIVIGRSWDLAAGGGTLTVLLYEIGLAGYAPSAKVDGAAGAGTSWTLQVTQSHYSDGNDSDYFADGMSVRLVGWDGTAREGVVVGTPTVTAIVVELATSWSGPAGYRYTLMFDTSDDAQTIEAQLEYAYQADARLQIPLAVGSSAARVFAP